MRAEETEQSRRSWLCWVGVLAVLLLALQAGRSALVAAEGERRPALAYAVWPSHPLPQVTMALASIGASARVGKAPQARALEQIRQAGRSDPLAVQPLLVAGTERLAAGDVAGGEQLLTAALRREPRSTAAHFLLADLYVRQQRLDDALVHVGVLGRRIRGEGTQAFAGALAGYLRDRGGVAQVRPVLQNDPSLRSGVMLSLAQDSSPKAAATLRALARRGDAGEEWFRTAFERYLAAGNIGEARALLGAAGIVGGGTSLSQWPSRQGVGPLSWRLPASADGAAEPIVNGPLRLIYYGRGDVVLADHLLLLPAGRFSLRALFSEALPAGTFEWRMTCLKGLRQLASWPIDAPSSSQMFEVPADCPAQRLSLWGRMGDFPRTTTAELIRVSLTPEARGR
jgi:thioredoxin-like negative regulator of GroEL